MRFAGKTAVVTGAGAGMGAAAAQHFAAEGARVALLDRDLAAAERVAQSIVDAGGAASAFACDVSKSADVASVIAAVAADFGAIDVLVNCAGVVRYGKVVDLDESEWDLQLDVNLKGTFLMCKYVIPHMPKPGGAIVNTASVQAFISQQTVAAYSASKGGVVAMTRTLALDHAAEGIRVNAICPGSVETPMLRQSAEEFFPDDPEGALKAWGAIHPLGFLAQPEDVARVIAFLASDDAKLITGAPILVDLGLSAKAAV